MTRIAVIMPFLTDYRRETLLELSQYCELDLVFCPTPEGLGYSEIPSAEGSPRIRRFMTTTVKPFGDRFGMIQLGVSSYLLRERPDAVLIMANPRYLTLWTTLLLGRVLGIAVYPHGHGIFKKARVRPWYRVMMTTLLKLATAYICYTPMVRQSFLENGFPAEKISVAHNSITNRVPVRPEEKTGDEPGILFIGRLRPDHGLAILFRVVERLRQADRLPLTVHVIGDGEQAAEVRGSARHRDWVIMHGAVFDPQQIRRISLQCFAGCYPGTAGLSVVHLLSLSLPALLHDDLRQQGPEASLVRHGSSGLLCDHRRLEDCLYAAIKSLATDRDRLRQMQRAAFDEYLALTNPSFAYRLWAVLAREPVGVAPVAPPALNRVGPPPDQP